MILARLLTVRLLAGLLQVGLLWDRRLLWAVRLSRLHSAGSLVLRRLVRLAGLVRSALLLALWLIVLICRLLIWFLAAVVGAQAWASTLAAWMRNALVTVGISIKIASVCRCT